MPETISVDYDGLLYFDTFPDVSGLDPVAECAANIDSVLAMKNVVERLRKVPALSQAIATQNSVSSQKIVQAALFAL